MKKHKFTWIDGLVIAVVVLLIAGTCIKFFVKDTTSATQPTVQFSYQLEISNVRNYIVDSLEIGDTVYDSEGKGVVGVISDILVEPAKTVYETPNGEVLQVETEGRYDITLTLRAEGIAADNTYKVGTYTLRVNKNALYFTKYSTWNAQIISID